MFNSITINFRKQSHTLGNIIECLLFYDNVNLIIGSRDGLPYLWSKVGIDGLLRLKKYGLHIYMATNTVSYGNLPGLGLDVHIINLTTESMPHRICSKAIQDFYEAKSLDAEQQRLVQQYTDITEVFSYSQRIRETLHSDIYQHFVHKDILQAQLREINSDISMFDTRVRYDFKQAAKGFTFDINLDTDELNKQAKNAGYSDIQFGQDLFLIKMTEVYGLMDFAAQTNSSLSVSPAESIIVSCKQKNVLQRYSEEQSQIDNFEKLEVSSSFDIAAAVDSGEKSIDDICELLDCAQEFKKWKSSVPNESEFLVEYHKALKANLPLVQRLPVKWARFIATAGIGAIPLVGTILGPVASGLDTFLVDKWKAGGWKPAQFVNGELKRFVSEMKKDETR